MGITGTGITVGGLATKSVIIVTSETGNTVKCWNEHTTKTAVEKQGQWRFDNIDKGIWTIEATQNGKTIEKMVNVDKFDVYYVDLSFVKIYGISRNITSSSPVWARTDKAIGMTATATVGTAIGKSDFDKAMPWQGIKRETLPTGDVMVKIPKFYFKRYREGNMEYIKIADKPTDGFAIHPLFKHAGKETECAYVGAYKTSSNNKSKTGVIPQADLTRAQFRHDAKAKGAGWGLIDIAALSAIQMLILVEYANNNVQQIIGRGYCDSNNDALRTGTCDSVSGLTGRPAGTDGKVDVVYRGIEGLWGNVFELCDGVNAKEGEYYVCNNPVYYADDTSAGYTKLSYKGSTTWSSTYITEEGLDTGENSHVMLPVAALNGSESTYMCDACWSVPGGWKLFAYSCFWGLGSFCGLFTASFVSDSSSSGKYFSSRLLYIPS